MIAEALQQIAEPETCLTPILEKPVLCTWCERELVPSLPEEEQDEQIEALQYEEIFYVFSERVCRECYEGE